MGELAHGTMLVGALAGTACAIAGLRSGRALDLAAATIMLAAMLDMAFIGFLPALVWVVLLLVTGLLLGARLRRFRLGPALGMRLEPTSLSRRLHRALAFIVGAWAFAAAAGTGAGASAHHHAAAAGSLGFAAAVVAMTVFGGWLVVRLFRAGRGHRLHAAEAASTTVMLAAMALPGLLPALG